MLEELDRAYEILSDHIANNAPLDTPWTGLLTLLKKYSDTEETKLPNKRIFEILESWYIHTIATNRLETSVAENDLFRSFDRIIYEYTKNYPPLSRLAILSRWAQYKVGFSCTEDADAWYFMNEAFRQYRVALAAGGDDLTLSQSEQTLYSAWSVVEHTTQASILIEYLEKTDNDVDIWDIQPQILNYFIHCMNVASQKKWSTIGYHCFYQRHKNKWQLLLDKVPQVWVNKVQIKMTPMEIFTSGPCLYTQNNSQLNKVNRSQMKKTKFALENLAEIFLGLNASLISAQYSIQGDQETVAKKERNDLSEAQSCAMNCFNTLQNYPIFRQLIQAAIVFTEDIVHWLKQPRSNKQPFGWLYILSSKALILCYRLEDQNRYYEMKLDVKCSSQIKNQLAEKFNADAMRNGVPKELSIDNWYILYKGVSQLNVQLPELAEMVTAYYAYSSRLQLKYSKDRSYLNQSNLAARINLDENCDFFGAKALLELRQKHLFNTLLLNDPIDMLKNMSQYSDAVIELIRQELSIVRQLLPDITTDMAICLTGSSACKAISIGSDLDVFVLISEKSTPQNRLDVSVWLQFMYYRLIALGEPWEFKDELHEPLGLGLDSNDVIKLGLMNLKKTNDALKTPKQSVDILANTNAVEQTKYLKVALLFGKENILGNFRSLFKSCVLKEKSVLLINALLNDSEKILEKSLDKVKKQLNEKIMLKSLIQVMELYIRSIYLFLHGELQDAPPISEVKMWGRKLSYYCDPVMTYLILNFVAELQSWRIELAYLNSNLRPNLADLSSRNKNFVENALSTLIQPVIEYRLKNVKTPLNNSRKFNNLLDKFRNKGIYQGDRLSPELVISRDNFWKYLTGEAPNRQLISKLAIQKNDVDSRKNSANILETNKHLLLFRTIDNDEKFKSVGKKIDISLPEHKADEVKVDMSPEPHKNAPSAKHYVAVADEGCDTSFGKNTEISFTNSAPNLPQDTHYKAVLFGANSRVKTEEGVKITFKNTMGNF